MVTLNICQQNTAPLVGGCLMRPFPMPEAVARSFWFSVARVTLKRDEIVGLDLPDAFTIDWGSQLAAGD